MNNPLKKPTKRVDIKAFRYDPKWWLNAMPLIITENGEDKILMEWTEDFKLRSGMKQRFD